MKSIKRLYASSTIRKRLSIALTCGLILLACCVQGNAQTTAHQAKLSWHSPTPIGGSGTIQGFNIYRNTTGGSFTKVNAALIQVTQLGPCLDAGGGNGCGVYTDLSVAAGTTYAYCGTTVDSLNAESACTVQVSATIPVDPPPPPPPPPPVSKYAPGDTFKVITSGARLNVRQAADPTAPIITTLSNGQLGTITGGLANGYWQMTTGFVSDIYIRQ